MSAALQGGANAGGRRGLAPAALAAAYRVSVGVLSAAAPVATYLP
jgi:hypothetical protein